MLPPRTLQEAYAQGPVVALGGGLSLMSKVTNWELYRAVQFSIEEQLLSRNVERFSGGLVFKAHRLVNHSTLGPRVIKKKKNVTRYLART